MHVLITGAAGMLGRKVVEALLAGALARPVTALTLVDLVAPDVETPGIPLTAVAADLSDPATVPPLLATRPDAIVHLAAMVSGAAEADVPGGYRANTGVMTSLLTAIQAIGQTEDYCPRLVFASSIAVFGTPLPDVIPDDFPTRPKSSYGTQKAICEMLLNDHARHGIVDGIGLRLPTLVVRPGKPNAAASGFMSGILREPLAGQRAVLPVGDDYRHWFASPRAAAGFVIHALTLDTAALGHERTLTMPGVSLTMGDLIDALRDHAGQAAVDLIDRVDDPRTHAIVTQWPRAFAATRASDLGFTAETSARALLEVYLSDMAE